MILSIPWLIISVILYNLIAFTFSWPPESAAGPFSSVLLTIPMISGASWSMTLGDLMIVITLAILFVELIKSTRTGEATILDHALSMVLFIICVIEFLTVRHAATSVFFIIVVITLIDVVAGFTISIRAARRDLTLGGAN
jgi:hypothetical protein